VDVVSGVCVRGCGDVFGATFDKPCGLEFAVHKLVGDFMGEHGVESFFVECPFFSSLVNTQAAEWNEDDLFLVKVNARAIFLSSIAEIIFNAPEKVDGKSVVFGAVAPRHIEGDLHVVEVGGFKKSGEALDGECVEFAVAREPIVIAFKDIFSRMCFFMNDLDSGIRGAVDGGGPGV